MGFNPCGDILTLAVPNLPNVLYNTLIKNMVIYKSCYARYKAVFMQEI